MPASTIAEVTDFFLAGGAQLVPISLATLERCRELIAQYSNLPMDFADSTLVALAEDLGTAWLRWRNTSA